MVYPVQTNGVPKRQALSPECAASAIWFAELTRLKGNRSCHVVSEKANVGSIVLIEVNLQPGGQGIVTAQPGFLASPRPFANQHFCNPLANSRS